MLCRHFLVAVPLEEDVEVLRNYLIQLVGTKNLEQLWRVLRFLDRYNCNLISNVAKNGPGRE